MEKKASAHVLKTGTASIAQSGSVTATSDAMVVPVRTPVTVSLAMQMLISITIDFVLVMIYTADTAVLSTMDTVTHGVLAVSGHQTKIVMDAFVTPIETSLVHVHVILTGAEKIAVYMRDNAIQNVRTAALDHLMQTALTAYATQLGIARHINVCATNFGQAQIVATIWGYVILHVLAVAGL